MERNLYADSSEGVHWQFASNLFNDAYEVVKEHPLLSAAGALTVGAAALCLSRGRISSPLASATESLIGNSVPISARTRAAAEAGLIGIGKEPQVEMIDALLKNGIAITPASRQILGILRAQGPGEAFRGISTSHRETLLTGIPINSATRQAVSELVRRFPISSITRW